jgi:hypothetical protein
VNDGRAKYAARRHAGQAEVMQKGVLAHCSPPMRC